MRAGHLESRRRPTTYDSLDRPTRAIDPFGKAITMSNDARQPANSASRAGRAPRRRLGLPESSSSHSSLNHRRASPSNSWSATTCSASVPAGRGSGNTAAVGNTSCASPSKLPAPVPWIANVQTLTSVEESLAIVTVAVRRPVLPGVKRI